MLEIAWNMKKYFRYHLETENCAHFSFFKKTEDPRSLTQKWFREEKTLVCKSENTESKVVHINSSDL